MAALPRPMKESDLAEADSIFRLAFGTFLGLPDPATFAVGHDYIRTRFYANPSAALALEIDGGFAGSNLAGSNMVSNWGSVGTFGPLTVRPERWNQGAAQALLVPTMDLFNKWGVRDAGLFTFVQSPKHLILYQKFGFWPRFMISLMMKAVTPQEAPFTTFTEDSGAEAACRQLTDSIFEGLDATLEIRSVRAQNLGETILIWGGSSLEAFAICHYGAGTEAGPDNLYIKFAAVRPGPNVSRNFTHLLNACEALASQRGILQIEAGINLERTRAYRQMLEHGFLIQRNALAMHRDNRPAYNRPDVYILDDWR
jgi:GNAT superfamily N-acetyltransferase